jgi:hypothetical protein
MSDKIPKYEMCILRGNVQTVTGEYLPMQTVYEADNETTQEKGFFMDKNQIPEGFVVVSASAAPLQPKTAVLSMPCKPICNMYKPEDGGCLIVDFLKAGNKAADKISDILIKNLKING